MLIMSKIIPLLVLIQFFFSFEVDEQLSITELEEEAEIFIFNESYVDAISNYEKIYDIQSLIFGLNHKNLANTLITLGDLYYRINDEVNALRCFQESIKIIHFNNKISKQIYITPLEYLFEIYLNNDQLEIASNISAQLSSLYNLDTLSYEKVMWTQILNNQDLKFTEDSLKSSNDSIITYIDPLNYLDSAKIYITNEKYKESVEPLLSAFIEGDEIITYKDYTNFYNYFTNDQLNELTDFLQILKYSDSKDIQAAIYFNLALIAFELGNNNLSFTYINEYSKLMPDEITTYIMLGNIYFNKNNYLDALLEYQKILWLYPQDLYALYQQAICFYRLEYYEDAKINFEKILSYKEDDYNSIYYLALIAYDDGYINRAIELFSNLLLYNTKDPTVYNYLGELYFRNDNLKQSLYSYEESIKIDPYNSEIYYYLGIIYEKLLNPTKSIKNYKQAIKMDNNNLDLVYRLGMILYKEGELKKSIEYLRSYVSSNYEDIEVLEILASILNSLDRFPEAIEIYKKLIDYNKNNIDYYSQVANLYWNLEDYEKSKYYYNIVLENNNFKGEVYYFLGYIANKEGQFELAKNYLMSAYECDYISDELFNQFAFSFVETQDYKDMIHILNQGLNFNPNNLNILYYLGIGYYEIGFYDKSIQFLKEYLLYNANDLTATYKIGLAYFHNDNFSNAYKYLLKTDSNDDYEIFYYLGASKYNLNEYKSAIPYFKKSLIINPNNKFAIYLLGQSYIGLGDKKESKRQLRLLMNIDNSLFDTLKLAFDSKFDI